MPRDEMPKKIYATILRGYWTVKSWHTKPTYDSVEYIRADLVDRMREALEAASDIFLAMDCDCCSLPGDEKCLRCYGMDSMTTALEEMKDE